MGEALFRKFFLLVLFVVCYFLSANDVFAAHPLYPSFSSASSGFNFYKDSGYLFVSDAAVYRTGWYSVNGSAWQNFSLSGNLYNNNSNWLRSSGSITLPSFGSGEHYIIVYSCSYSSGWDCHEGKWQLYIVNNTISSGELKYLVRNNVGYADIVVSSSATNMVKLAADYFQDYIYNMTGVLLPISNTSSAGKQYHVYIGRSNYTDALGINSDGCKDGGFKIISGDNYLVFIGDDAAPLPLGPFHGPPNMKTPEALYTEWDALTNAKWGNEYIEYYYRRYNEVYGIREGDGKGSMNAVYEFLYDQGIRWYAPGRLGTIIPTKESISFQDMNKLVNPDFAMRNMWFYYRSFLEVNPYFFPNGAVDDELKWQMSLRTNDVIKYLGYPYVHSMRTILGRDEMKSAHPEYYAIWNGVRMNTSWDFKPDLCSQGLFEETVRYVKTMFDIYNDSYVNIMPTDGFYMASESSPECKARETPERGYYGGISDYVWEFTNNVAWAIYNDPKYAGKMISAEAYTTYMLPPEHLSKPVAPNLAVMISSGRSEFQDEAVKAFNRDVRNQWLSFLPSKEIYTYDFYLASRPDTFTQSVPTLFPHIISDDLKFLKGKSQGEAMEINTNAPEWNLSWDTFAATSLDVYVTARLYWDADQDVDTLLDEYYTLYYGPARTQMKAFVEYSEAHYGNVINDPAIMHNMRKMLTDAKAVAGNTIYGERIDKLIGLINSNYKGDDVLINSCQVLDSPVSTYKLTADVSSAETCFTVETFGVTIDCQGHTITYATDGGNDKHAVYAEWYKNALTIKNCNIQSGSPSSGDGIRISRSSGVTIKNSRINTTGNGIWFIDDENVSVTGNTIASVSGVALFNQNVNGGMFSNNNLSSISAYGLYPYESYNFTITGNNVSSITNFGLDLTEAANNTLTNNIFASDTGMGVWLATAANNIFVNNTAFSRTQTGLFFYDKTYNNTFVGQTATGGQYGVVFSGASSGNVLKDCGAILGGEKNVLSYAVAGSNSFVNCTY